MMVYIGLLYQDLIKRKEVLADGRLSPILPIVLYNGKQRWTSVTDVAELIPVVPGLVEQFKPRLKSSAPDTVGYRIEAGGLHARHAAAQDSTEKLLYCCQQPIE